MKRTFVLFLVLSFPALALETDNYLSWAIELEDSGEDINTLIKNEITDVLELSNQNENPASCELVTFQIAHRFKTTPRRKLFEDWSEEHLVPKMFPETPKYLFESIYKNTSRFYLRFSGLSPNVQTNGIYFGVDKLSHFGSTGRRYLKHYLKKVDQGYSSEAAERSAIRFGLSNEAGVLGMWPSGVFSYGDMEANYQGFRFYKKLCLDEENTYLKIDNGKWKLDREPDIREYVNPYWDESFNLSYRSAGIWARSSLIIKDQYCPLRNSEMVLKRMALYKDLAVQKSFSLTYIEELQAEGYEKAPDPKASQSIDELCEEKDIHLM